MTGNTPETREDAPGTPNAPRVGASATDHDPAVQTWETIAGLCTACRSIEVVLIEPTGTRDLTYLGESDAYPTGYGCEVCS